MAEISNTVVALVTYLAAQSGISDLVAARVYGTELPKDDSVSMARKAIVIKRAGGIGEDSQLDVFKHRLDFTCYGETPFEADRVWRAVRTELRDLTRTIVGTVILYNATHSAGPFSLRDQPTEWPMVVDTWLVKAQD